MRILYIHGLDSSPNPDRIGWLERRLHEVVALHIDYRSTPNAYQLLYNEAVAQHIELIIGSSLGGRMGYWLGEELGIASLLFNPAVAKVIPGLYLPDLSIDTFRCPARDVILGAKDDVVNPHDTWEWLRSREREGLRQRILLCEWLGHQIDQPTFTSACLWAGL